MRKKLEELNLLDNFLFGQMMTYPDTGKEFTRILLRIIFGREFDRLTVIPQKVYYGSDTNLHGVRLDVYIEDDENSEITSEQATIYDIEPDKNDSKEKIKHLPKRVRFYHAKIDSRSLKSGEKYGKLKNVVVVMITSYDPFGLNRMVYTIKNRCVEEPDMEYEDGASTLFLYTKGTEGESSETLKQLLHYMEHTTKANAVNNDLEGIHKMVETVKQDSEVASDYMLMMEDEDVLLERGREEGREEGSLKTLITMTCRKLRKSKTPKEIAEELEEDIQQITEICEAAKQCTPEYDVDKIYEIIMQNKATA